jgi:predicted Fe-S protein YdhL (DUF1289 family)
MTIARQPADPARLPKPLDSPCIDICQLDPRTRLCVGCRRTIDEIAAWGSLSPAERRRVLDQLPARTSH